MKNPVLAVLALIQVVCICLTVCFVSLTVATEQAAAYQATSAAPQQSDLPARGAIEITAADSDLTVPVRALYVGTTGNVKVTMVNGDVVTFTNVPVGLWPYSVKRVWSTGTTASGFVGLR